MVSINYLCVYIGKKDAVGFGDSVRVSMEDCRSCVPGSIPGHRAFCVIRFFLIDSENFDCTFHISDILKYLKFNCFSIN